MKTPFKITAYDIDEKGLIGLYCTSCGVAVVNSKAHEKFHTILDKLIYDDPDWLCGNCEHPKSFHNIDEPTTCTAVEASDFDKPELGCDCDEYEPKEY
jgi:hypothetical protein